MKKLLPTALLCLLGLYCSAQSLSIRGNIQDTTKHEPLKNAVVMALRLSDSALITFSRTDANGNFVLQNLKIDTIKVLITHPLFGEQEYYVFGSQQNKEFDFGKIIMPPKSLTTKEVVIYAYKDPVYFKGDTLVYTADSFKVKPNAVVEDLLKKLPGIKVDAKGEITSQGKKIEQVLVDGDEFFGTDPTVATKNLAASAVESVQVYEKKNETGTGENETSQVIDLKLKADAKKGYFGKISSATNVVKFHESELFLNKFKNKQKVSIFGQAGNTPRTSVGFADAYKYGLSGELNGGQGEEDGEFYYTNMGGGENGGIPKNRKAGVYYNDKLSKNTKIGANYTYKSLALSSIKNTNTQYFFTDTTYKTAETTNNKQLNENHIINANIEQTIDSLTTLKTSTNANFSPSIQQYTSENQYYTNTDSFRRSTNVFNNNTSNSNIWGLGTQLSHKFMKKDRSMRLIYNLNISDNILNSLLQSNNIFANNENNIANIDQNRKSTATTSQHQIRTSYTEPINLKNKIELQYEFNTETGYKKAQTFNNKNGVYSEINTSLSNAFESHKNSNTATLKYMYEVKKTRLTLGTALRNTRVNNLNLINQNTIQQNVNFVLPSLKYRYKFSDNSSLNAEYTTKAQLPSVNQLQPLQDNTNPNHVVIGNPNLLPQYKNSYALTYNSYKPISGNYVFLRGSFDNINNDFSSAIAFDSLGRSSSQTINVNGNIRASLNSSFGIALYKNIITLRPFVNESYSQNKNYINQQENTTSTLMHSFGGDIGLQTDKLEGYIGGSYSYYIPKSILNQQNNQPYSSYELYSEFTLKLTEKTSLNTSTNYTVFNRRSNGYNINYFIWNASLSHNFLKNENLILSVDAVDILNQNTNYTRTVQNNTIVDSRNNVIGRYIMMHAVFKFNSEKRKETDDFDF